MTAEFDPMKYRRWLQRVFYAMVALALLAVVVVRFATVAQRGGYAVGHPAHPVRFNVRASGSV